METKTCPLCQEKKLVSEFYNRTAAKDGKDYYCKLCSNKQKKDWYEKNIDGARAYRRQTNRNLKLEVIQAYGGKCECCGENRHEFLVIDHINNNGAEERKKLKISCGTQTYRYLKTNGWPEGHRVLCHNCNASYGYFGYCPHKEQPATWERPKWSVELYG